MSESVPSTLEAYRTKARAWLWSMAPTFGWEAARGLTDQEALALGRRYLAARYEAGYGGINLPLEWGGQGLGYTEKLAFESEQLRFGMPTKHFSITLGMPVPMLIRFASNPDWAKPRVVAALKGEEIWCQLFSEPAAGSDLAGLRTRAEKDGNGWKLTGQKLWISWAQYADYGVIVARSDPQAPKHTGLTYFWVDMKAPGVEVRPVKLAGGGSHVNEVFFDAVKLTDEQRMGPVGGGFTVAIATLMAERYVAMNSSGFGPHLNQFTDLMRTLQINGRPALEDGRVRSVLARNFAVHQGLEAIAARSMLMLEAGMEAGPEGSINKLLVMRSKQRLFECAVDLQGGSGLAFDRHACEAEDWTTSWLNAAIGRIAGGTDEMLLNTIAEKILGLPQDHRPDKGIPFNQIPA